MNFLQHSMERTVFGEINTNNNLHKNQVLSSGMDFSKSSQQTRDVGQRSEQGFRIEGLKQSIIAVYGDAMDKIGFSITEKANRSAQSRLGKTLRNLETMESKEQAQYRRQKQELLDSLDRLQGEQLKIRKVKQQYNKGLQKQTLGCSVPKYHTAINREKYGAIEYHNQVQGQDCSDGPQNIKAKHEQCADKPAITSLTVSLTGPKQRPSSSTAITNKSYEHSSNILRPLTPEIPCRLPNINVMDTCLTASSSCHDISHGKTEVINPKQNPVQRIQSDELMLKSDGKLQQDQANVNREQRSASFSQYGVHRRPNISREGICASPLATKSTIPSSSTGYSQKHFKAQSQNNSPLLPRRKLCRAKDWIPPEKEDLLAELEDYKLELQERVQHFLTTNNPQ